MDSVKQIALCGFGRPIASAHPSKQKLVCGMTRTAPSSPPSGHPFGTWAQLTLAPTGWAVASPIFDVYQLCP